MAVLTALAWGIGGLAVLIVPLLLKEAGVWQGVALMAGTVWFTGLLSVLPVAALGPLGVMPAVKAYFIGAGVRVALCLIVLALALSAWKLPKAALVIGLMGVYLPILFVETTIVVNYVKQKRPTPGEILPEADDASAQGKTLEQADNDRQLNGITPDSLSAGVRHREALA